MSHFDAIVILTGAGVSAESGLRTFRGTDGLWEGHRVEDVATPEAFARDPQGVQRFYNTRRQQLLNRDVHPNAAHEALARLEAAWPGDFLLVTQNIDNLHERAGSRRLVHMHGELLKARCTRTGTLQDIRGDLGAELPCQCCGRPGQLRPHVVWFGEVPLAMERIIEALSRCDLFVAIGTSGQVYPAAGFVELAREAGAETLEINLEPSRQGSLFEHQLQGAASTAVPSWVDRLMARLS